MRLFVEDVIPKGHSVAPFVSNLSPRAFCGVIIIIDFYWRLWRRQEILKDRDEEERKVDPKGTGLERRRNQSVCGTLFCTLSNHLE